MRAAFDRFHREIARDPARRFRKPVDVDGATNAESRRGLLEYSDRLTVLTRLPLFPVRKIGRARRRGAWELDFIKITRGPDCEGYV